MQQVTRARNKVFSPIAVVPRPPEAHDGSIDKVSSLIAGTLAKRGLAQHALASLTLHRVNAWLAKRLPPGSARATRIADHVLTVECSHSIVLQELQLQSAELRAFIASECPFSSITDLRLSRSDGNAGNTLAPGNPPA